MTAATLDFTAGRGGTGERARWTVSLVVVVAAHGFAALALASWQRPVELPAPPPAAVLVDLAPLPTLPEPVPQIAPPPEPMPEPLVELTPPEPLPEPIMEPEPEPKPKVVPEVPLPPRSKPQRKPLRVEQPTKPVTDPRVAELQPPTPEPLPAAGPPPQVAPAPPSHVMPTFEGLLRAHLERHKRYPRSAQLRREQGVSTLRFIMDREGHVLAAQIERSSGHAALDEEVLAMIKRAEPLPRMPAELERGRLELVVPLQFSLR